MAAQRICSLLPSATEIVCALGLQDRLVAITHECDYPPEIARLPRVTSSVIDSRGMSSREIDDAVRRSLENLSTIYYIDRELLASLQPDLILTQELCEVCAVSFGRVQEAASAVCKGSRIISLEPSTIEEILQSLRDVGEATDAQEAAADATRRLRDRYSGIRRATTGLATPRVLALEWLDPPFTAGHWVPEMIEAAGGDSLLARPGQRSRQVTWTEIIQTDPDVVVLMPCGYDLAATLHEAETVRLPHEFWQMRAVAIGRVFAVDGSAYFNRPGPRVIDGVEILAGLLHPEAFPAPAASQARGLELRGWGSNRGKSKS